MEKLFHTDLELYFINNYFLYLNETIISLPVNISSAHYYDINEINIHVFVITIFSIRAFLL